MEIMRARQLGKQELLSSDVDRRGEVVKYCHEKLRQLSLAPVKIQQVADRFESLALHTWLFWCVARWGGYLTKEFWFQLHIVRLPLLLLENAGCCAWMQAKTNTRPAEVAPTVGRRSVSRGRWGRISRFVHMFKTFTHSTGDNWSELEFTLHVNGSEESMFFFSFQNTIEL